MKKHCRTCKVVLTKTNIVVNKSRGRICKSCDNIRVVNFRRHIKAQVMEAYGNKCVCCGETNIVFLTIDHIDGSGAIQREEIGPGNVFYIWLKNHNYPKDNYQVLCWNCNAAKHILGICPHQHK